MRGTKYTMDDVLGDYVYIGIIYFDMYLRLSILICI